MSASHISATCLIHFGFKCSSPCPIPLLHIPELKPINWEQLLNKIPEFGSKVCVLGTNLPICAEIQEILKLQSREIALRNEADTILYVGSGCCNSSLIQTPEQNVWVLTEDKCELIDAYQFISKRFHYISQVSEAQVFGVIISNLQVYNKIERKLKGLLALYNKVFYPIYLGKITPLKLGNFREIDLFVMVSCENTLLPDNKELYKPVITPFELEVGLRGNWAGKYSTEFLGDESVDSSRSEGIVDRFGQREFKGLEIEKPGSVQVEDGYSGIPMCYKSEISNN
jgi:diphthamide synthase subunit DPH2